MPFEITVTQRPPMDGVESSAVKMSGALDLSSAPQAAKVLTGLVATNPKVVAFDLAKLVFVDSTGISLLLKTRRDLEAKGGSVFITNMQPSIRKVFDIVKALPGTAVFSNMKEMDEYLKGIQEKIRDEE